jgi:AraC-like DNA-binding protein
MKRLALILLLLCTPALAYDANHPELNSRFDHLSSAKGLCCSFVDGRAVADPDWDSKVRDLSAVARRSPAHFSRKFKLAVGDSPHAYVVKRRLETACHLMMTSAEPLSEIALSVGFSDQAHLCRLFRQAFGQSPAHWRRERGIPGEVTSRAGIDENIRRAISTEKS